MDRKIRIGAVSYLNTLPLVYGFNEYFRERAEIFFDYPSLVAKKLLDDEIDLGLVPVAIIPQLSEAYIVSDYCIGASKKVASVCLFSDVPVEEIKVVLSDYQSRTSAALLKILLKEYWKVNPAIENTFAGYESHIKGTTAGLVIGDRALQLHSKHKYVYDLAEAWMALTGLPFVFAAWVANKKLGDDFIIAFNNATGLGLKHLESIVELNKVNYYDLLKYYKEDVDYLLDSTKRKGLELFLEKIT